MSTPYGPLVHSMSTIMTISPTLFKSYTYCYCTVTNTVTVQCTPCLLLYNSYLKHAAHTSSKFLLLLQYISKFLLYSSMFLHSANTTLCGFKVPHLTCK